MCSVCSLTLVNVCIWQIGKLDLEQVPRPIPLTRPSGPWSNRPFVQETSSSCSLKFSFTLGPINLPPPVPYVPQSSERLAFPSSVSTQTSSVQRTLSSFICPKVKPYWHLTSTLTPFAVTFRLYEQSVCLSAYSFSTVLFMRAKSITQGQGLYHFYFCDPRSWLCDQHVGSVWYASLNKWVIQHQNKEIENAMVFYRLELLNIRCKTDLKDHLTYMFIF